MVVSFKISRFGSRYRPKPKTEPPSAPELEVDAPAQLPKFQSPSARKRSVDFTERNDAESSDAEISFILNIFPDGYTLVNPSESNDDPGVLRPYDRRSENLITWDFVFLVLALTAILYLKAIECGYLPVNFLDEIHCKYINGTVLCEVRDYRKESSESAVNGSSTAVFPSITRVSLKMSLDNVVKDIHLFADSTWEYGDLLEAESQILLALQPKLFLDPTPNLDRLCREPTSIKLNLDIRGKRLKRLRQMTPENSNSSVTDSRQVMSKPDLVNLVEKNVGQSTMVDTGPKIHAPEHSNLNVRDLRQVTGQPDLVNLVDRIFGKSNMVATGPKIHAPENLNSSVRDLRQVTGQPYLVNLVEKNVGHSNMVATGPKIHAPENSNLSVRNSRQVSSQPGLVNLVDKNVGQRYMVSTEAKIHVPENSNMRVSDLIRITGHPDCVNLVNLNVSQSNMIAIGSKNCAPYTAISSVSHQSSHQIGVGNLLNMQNHINDISSSSIMSSVNDKRGNHCQVLSMVNINKRGRSIHVELDGNQHMDNNKARRSRLENTQVRQPLTIQQMNDGTFTQYNVKQEPVETEKMNNFDPNRLHQRVPKQFTKANFHKAPWNNMSPNLENNIAGTTSVPVVGDTRTLTFSANESMQQSHMAANWRSNTLQKAPVISGLGSSSSVGNIIGPFTTSSPIDGSMWDRFSKIKMLTARFKLNCKKNMIDEYKPTIIFPTKLLERVLFNDHNKDILQDETCEMPLSMSLMGGNINICKTRVLNFVLDECPLPENGILSIPEFHTRMILSERQSDGTVAMHQGELDGVDYLADDELLPTLPTTHMADLLAKQFLSLMLREGYKKAGDHLKPKPISMVRSTGGQPNTTPEDFNDWLQQILESDPRESIYEVAEPSISGASLHNMHLQFIQLFQGVSARTHPHMVNNNRESHLQNQFLQQQEQSQIQRKMMMRPDCMVGFQGLGMGGDGRAGTRVVSPTVSQNPMATKQGMGQSKTNWPGGLVGQSSNFGGLQGANRQIHLGSGSGSGSSGVLMLGSGIGINRANDMNPMQRNVMGHLNPNQNQNRYMNQQQFQLIKQEPTSHLQAVLLPSQQAGSPSPSSGRPHHQVGPHQPTL
ncbi:hypothetical protein L1987_30920 [Smallanthus sonchifolius]|uniref:Uncharacterized protein n=1 Tax=Smallanthus sonchifolius TaxID=185202 RepID=A0ACB9I3Y5_9ASTR|nr:hypothetical protein L1987_30920 [Smallanthus sonchifolius]